MRQSSGGTSTIKKEWTKGRFSWSLNFSATRRKPVGIY
jgi:hypothetical protein